MLKALTGDSRYEEVLTVLTEEESSITFHRTGGVISLSGDVIFAFLLLICYDTNMFSWIVTKARALC